MFENPQSPNVRFFPSSGFLETLPKDHEVFVLSLHALENPQKISYPKRSWTALAQNKIEELKRDLSKKSKSASTKLNFPEDGSATFIFLADELSTFEVHEILRKNTPFKNVLKKRESELVIHLQALHHTLQKVCMDALGGLSSLSQWSSPIFGQKADKKSPSKSSKSPFRISAFSGLPLREAEEIFERGFLLGRGTNLVRTLAALPSNILTPDSYYRFVQKHAKTQGYQSEFFNYQKLKKMGAGAFCAVVQADENTGSGILHLTYSPKTKNKKSKKIALVGKGLCYDTGGYNIKVGSSMNGMHQDMTGSAVALALFETLVAEKSIHEVHCYMALAENLISPSAFRPNDVVIALDGTSIEVVDTDAEGRMVLSDTLALARKEKPDLVLDFATLTGAAVRSIGTHRAAVFCNQDKLHDVAFKAGVKSGERVWGFPIGSEFQETLKSEVADILQCLATPSPDHCLAATFLAHFIGEETPWIHMDLSAHETKGGLGLVATENTGFGVRWGYEAIQDYFFKP